MTISEMHIWFRQYAQQMGMQNVRAILPEQIDVLINTSISDIVNQLIRENVGVTNDRIITDNVKLNQINALRTLYKVQNIDMSPASSDLVAFSFSGADRQTGKMSTTPNASTIIPKYLYLVDFAINYKAVTGNLGYVGSNHSVFSVKTANGAVNSADNYLLNNVDSNGVVSIEVYNPVDEAYQMKNFVLDTDSLVLENDDTIKLYAVSEDGDSNAVAPYFIILESSDTSFGTKVNPVTVTTTNYIQPSFDADALETNYFPIRIIQDSYLADTLNDFVLKNRLRSPIIVTYNDNTFDLYIDKFNSVTIGGNTRYVLNHGLIPYKLRMSYIAEPAKVKYLEDLTGNASDNVDCDLPENMHIDILKHAVDLYNTSIQGNLYNAQQQQQGQNREMSRNQARSDNEGYQN